MKLEFSRQILEKYLIIKFNENVSIGSRVVPCRWTDRHDEVNSGISQFCGRAYKEFFLFNSHNLHFVKQRSA